jgi:PAS domain S-box-containing protein
VTKPASGSPRRGVPPWVAYLVAFVAPLVALGIRLNVTAFGPRPLLLLFVPPILLAAFVGGLWPGLTATAFTAAITLVFLLPPTPSLAIASTYDAVQWLIFIVTGLAISILSESLRRTRRQAASYPVLEARLAQVAATIPGVLYSFQRFPDGHSLFPYTNSAFADLMGLDSDAARRDATHTFDRIHPEDVARVQASIAESERLLKPWHGEFRSRHPQRGEIWIEARSVPQRMPDGSTLWSGFASDITERKRSERKLQESEAELRALFASMNDVILVLDAEGHYLKIAPTNPANLYQPPRNSRAGRCTRCCRNRMRTASWNRCGTPCGSGIRRTTSTASPSAAARCGSTPPSHP